MAFVEVSNRGTAGVASYQLGFDLSDGKPTLAAGWRMDGEQLKVWADRLGMVPIFYAIRAGTLVVADSLSEVVCRLDQRRLDDEAVATFMALGYLLGNQTVVDGVKVLMPGEQLLWSQGNCTSTWGGYPDYGVFSGSWAEAKKEFQGLFSKAIESRARHGVGNLPLSGGRDSRHICLELAKQGMPPPKTLALQGAPGDESEQAKQVSEHLGIDCLIVQKEGDYASGVIQKNRLNFYSTDENAWYLYLLPHLKGPVFDGLAGDVLCNGSYFDATLAKQISSGAHGAAATRLLEGQEYLSFLRSHYRSRWSSKVALGVLDRELAKHSSAADPVKAFLFWNRIRREIALLPLTMASTKVPVALPYESPELLRFFMSLPWQGFSLQAFHDEVIRDCYPAAAHIPYGGNDSGQRQRRPLRRVLPQALNMAKPLISRPAKAERIAAYLAESLLRRSLTPLSPSFSKLMPVVQAVRELELDI